MLRRSLVVESIVIIVNLCYAMQAMLTITYNANLLLIFVVWGRQPSRIWRLAAALAPFLVVDISIRLTVANRRQPLFTSCSAKEAEFCVMISLLSSSSTAGAY